MIKETDYTFDSTPEEIKMIRPNVPNPIYDEDQSKILDLFNKQNITVVQDTNEIPVHVEQPSEKNDRNPFTPTGYAGPAGYHASSGFRGYGFSGFSGYTFTPNFERPDIVEKIHKMYPEMMEEYRKIMYEQYETFCKKQLAYGKGNIMLGGDVDSAEDRDAALKGLVIRMNDKIQRLINLVLKSRENAVADESIEDTFGDLSVYGIIARLVQRKKWCK